jgi:hypothetical protein
MAFLPRRSSSAPPHFLITDGTIFNRVWWGTGASYETEPFTFIPTYQWLHFAITIGEPNEAGTRTYRMYVNGTQVGINRACTLTPSILGNTTYNWLGRSLDPTVEGPWYPGYLDDFRIYNKELTAAEVIKAMGNPTITFRSPSNGRVFPGGTTSATMSWISGAYADAVNGNHVFFGDNWDNVNNGTGGTDRGLTSNTSYTATGLVPGVTYYWRVDSVSGTNVWRSDIWSFMVMPVIAFNPTPSDGATLVSPKVTLHWMAGTGAVDGHYIYLSDNLAAVNNAPEGSMDPPYRATVGLSSDPNWCPAKAGITLVPNKTYYWRIDEASEIDNIYEKGNVWRFTTVPNSPPSTEPNLIGWWKLDNDVTDSAYGCDGTEIGGPVYDAGYFNTAIRLDNTGDSDLDNDIYVSLPIGSEISSLSASTFAIYVNWQGAEGGRNNQRIFTIGTDSVNFMRLSPHNSASAPLHFLIIKSGYAQQMVGYGANTFAGNAGTLLPTGTWQHVAVTISEPNAAGSRTYKLYLNGQQVGINTDANLAPQDLGFTTMNWLGRSEAPLTQRPFWGSLDDFRIYDRVLSQEEVQALTVNLCASNISPRHRAIEVIDTPTLRWRAGSMAAKHNVYFGTDEAAVAAATTATPVIYCGQQVLTNAKYVPTEVPLEWNQVYYWRIDEVESGGMVHAGNVWSFTTADFAIVENFEDYNDYSPTRVFQTWTDGYGYSAVPLYGLPAYCGNDTGVTIGHDIWSIGSRYYNSSIMETANVRTNSLQSMPFYYNNSGTTMDSCGGMNPLFYSETERTFSTPQDWTRKGVKALALWFRGYPPSVGSMSYDAATGTYTIKSSGTNIWGTGDEFHFAFKQLTGDGTIVARIDSLTTNTPARAGVMIRDSLDWNSALADAVIGTTNFVAFQWRTEQGADMSNPDSSTQTATNAFTLPHWVKLIRAGNVFSVQHSANGTTWEEITPETAGDPTSMTIQMSDPVYIGLCVTARNTTSPSTTTCTATISNVTITPSSAVTPAGPFTTSQDVGIISNNNEPLYVTVTDAANNSQTVAHSDPNLLSTDWSEWNIPLTTFSNAGVALNSIEKIALRVGDRASTVAGGKGVLFFDDIRLHKPRCMTSLASLPGDIDGDCMVDYVDLDTMAEQWLETSPPARTADLNADTRVDLKDYASLAQDWLEEILWP